MHPSGVSMDEADGWVTLGQVLECKSVHRCGVVYHVDEGVVVFEREIVRENRTFFAASEDTEDARCRGPSEKGKKVRCKSHAGVVRERRALVDALDGVYQNVRGYRIQPHGSNLQCGPPNASDPALINNRSI